VVALYKLALQDRASVLNPEGSHNWAVLQTASLWRSNL
jgi:hypothetical protein